jgi:hypothetical protein
VSAPRPLCARPCQRCRNKRPVTDNGTCGIRNARSSCHIRQFCVQSARKHRYPSNAHQHDLRSGVSTALNVCAFSWPVVLRRQAATPPLQDTSQASVPWLLCLTNMPMSWADASWLMQARVTLCLCNALLFPCPSPERKHTCLVLTCEPGACVGANAQSAQMPATQRTPPAAAGPSTAAA